MDRSWKRPEFNGYVLPTNGSEKEIITSIIRIMLEKGSMTEDEMRDAASDVEPGVYSSWLFHSQSNTWIHPAGRLWYKVKDMWQPISGLNKFYNDVIKYDEYIFKKRIKLMKKWEHLLPRVGDLFMENVWSIMSMVVKIEEYAKTFPQGGWKIYLTDEVFVVTVPAIKAWITRHGNNIKYGDPVAWKTKTRE